MRTLHVLGVKVVAAGGDLDAATLRPVVDDTVTVNIEGVAVEHKRSDNPNPAARDEIGTMYTVRWIYAESDETELIEIIGGATVTNVTTKTQGLRALPKYDIRLHVVRQSDKLTILEDFTDMQFEPKVELARKQGDNTYLPVEAKSSSTTDYSIDNSAS